MARMSSIWSPGSITMASRDCSSPTMEQLHCSGPTAMISWITLLIYRADCAVCGRDATIVTMRKTIIVSVISVALCAAALAQTSTGAGASKPATQRKAGAVSKPKPAATAAKPAITLKDTKDRASYGMGLNMGLNLRRHMVELDPDILAQGLRDGYNNNPKPLMTEDEANDALMQMDAESRARADQRHAQEVATNKAAGEGFLLANKSQPGVVTLPSGLQYKVLIQ